MRATRLYLDEALPAPGEVDFLAIMGGPMSVHDTAEHPWLSNEPSFIRAVIDQGTPVLGVCLGAQLTALALGAQVYPNSIKDIGWWPVRRSSGADAMEWGLPEVFDAFHWHGETFSLPEQAVCLASTPACTQQAFAVGTRVLGLQFHLEATPESVADLARHCPEDIAEPGPAIRSLQETLNADSKTYRRAHLVLGQLLSRLVKSSQG